MKAHEELVMNLAKPGQQIVEDIDAAKAHLLHMASGVCGESGEVMEQIKKHAIYGKALDPVHIVEELGDLLFYAQGIALACGSSLEECMLKNIEKLNKRYASGSYSDKQALERADKK